MGDQELKTPDFTLRVEAGVDQGQVFLLLNERMVVGRSSIADIEIHEIFAARRHFEIVWNEEQSAHGIRTWSINPIFVNGVELDRNAEALRKLEAGDVISLGSTVIVYERLTTEQAGSDHAASHKQICS